MNSETNFITAGVMVGIAIILAMFVFTCSKPARTTMPALKDAAIVKAIFSNNE